jgi:excinuclease ABC subunit B
MEKFILESPFKPVVEQLEAVTRIVQGIERGEKSQVLLGVTGSGKTFTLANVIAHINRPTLVISHNKTLAAQLYSEFKEFFPHNAVEYFVSYYDYYQPEAYIPHTDVYIEKDASINDRLDRLRLSSTTSLMSRRDVIIVASVSCIYNLGSPEDYRDSLLFLEEGQEIDRDEALRKLISIQYERNDYEFSRGKLRVRGDTLEVFPAYRQDALRIQFFGDEIEKISQIDPVTGDETQHLGKVAVFPAKHFIISQPRLETALAEIEDELKKRLEVLNKAGKLAESQRLNARTRYDMDMMREMGYCHGIENYSRALSGRPTGSRPSCLIDYFPSDFLTIIDESHVTVPQLNGMYEGDRSRKQTLVEYGFRLPSCLDNRPLKFDELKEVIGQKIYVSATPAPFEKNEAGKKNIVEQIIRPTGIVDPPIEVRPTQGQIDDLLGEIRKRAAKHERVLVTTLTKRMAEDLSTYLEEKEIKVKYLHSDIQTIDRAKILHDLRMRKFDCLIGVNLLREGLDLPEVSLVAIFDADKEGFLRSQTSLIQTAGRAARNVNGLVIMYADSVSLAMRATIAESERRRKIQLAFNKEHGITPQTIKKAIRQGIEILAEEAEEVVRSVAEQSGEDYVLNSYVTELEREMEQAARNLQFEKAARIRDKIKEIKGKKVN